MKRKITITFLIAILTTMMSLSALATEFMGKDDTILISPRPQVNYVQNEDEYAVMPITDNATIKVQLDGQNLDFTDANGNVVNPQIINDRTMVPMRKIFETFEAEVNWDAATRTVVATTEEKEITLTIDSNTAKLKNLTSNEEKEITLDAAPVILEDRTMVPVRFIAESLEKEVGWDAANRTVIIIDFDKFEKELEEKAPTLKDLFEVEVEPLESFKSTSEIKGSIVYKDPEDKANNETVNIDGELKMNVNKNKDLEMYFELEFDGKGAIYDSIEEAGYEDLEFAIVVVDGKTYVMMKQNGEEVWAEAGDAAELTTSLSSLQTTNSPKSYAEYVETIKTSLGELNVNSYAIADQMIDMFAEIYSKENLKVSGSSSKKTVEMTIDFKEIIALLVPEMPEDLDNAEFKMTMIEKISNKKVDTAEVNLELTVKEPTTKESVEIDFGLEMKISAINKDIKINTPKVTAE